MSSPPPSTKGELPDCDVEITLSRDRILQAHSFDLRQCSKWFAGKLAGLPADKLVRGHPRLWRYELVLSKESENDWLYSEEDPECLTTDKVDESKYDRDDSYYTAYENLFKIFYRQEPLLEGLEDVVRLVQLAEKYESLRSISGAVRLSLMEAGGRPASLYADIAADPVNHLYIGEMIRSSFLVREAAIHVLGTWDNTESACRGLISDRLFESLASRRASVCEKMNQANKLLLLLNYQAPISLTSSQDCSMAALNAIRSLISDAFRSVQKRSTSPQEGHLYRLIARSADMVERPANILASARSLRTGMNFAESCSDLRKTILYALGSLPDCHLESVRLHLPSYILSTSLEGNDLSWESGSDENTS